MCLTSTDQRHHFKLIAGLQNVFCVPPARDKLQVHFDGHVARFELEQFEQVGDAAAVGDDPILTVDENVHVEEVRR